MVVLLDLDLERRKIRFTEKEEDLASNKSSPKINTSFGHGTRSLLQLVWLATRGLRSTLRRRQELQPASKLTDDSARPKYIRVHRSGRG